MSERIAAFRKRMKEQDPAKYAAYLEKQRASSKKRREDLKKELKKAVPNPSAVEKHNRQKELAKHFFCLANAKKKANNALQPTAKKPTKVLTRSEQEDKRAKNREYKKKERAGHNRQKKEWVKRKDRERKRSQREAKKEKKAIRMM